MPCSSRVISEMLPEIDTTEMCNFLKPIINSQNSVLLVVILQKLSVVRVE